MKQTKLDIFRWILLVPVTLAVSCLVLLFIMRVTVNYILGCSDAGVSIVIIGVIIPVVWLTMSYFLAPHHKETVVWTSLGLGVGSVLIISRLAVVIIGTSPIFNCDYKPWIIVAILAIVAMFTGLLTTLFFQKKLKHKAKNS